MRYLPKIAMQNLGLGFCASMPILIELIGYNYFVETFLKFGLDIP